MGINYNHNSDVGHKNLIPITERDPEEAKRICAKGAAAARAIQKKRRTMKESLDLILSLPAKDLAKENLPAETIAKFEEAGIEIDYGTLITAKMAEQSRKGDIKAAQFVRDTSGEMPTNKQEITATITDGDMELINKMSKRLGIGSNDPDKG
jgi:hypothetical protein